MPEPGAVLLAPITGDDLPEVGAFLHDRLNRRLSAQAWAQAIVPTWPVRSPNHGFLLRDTRGQDRPVVGVQLAFYAERDVDGRPERFCNLGAWCVLEGYREHGLRLLRAVLAQRDQHVTDLSPSGNVVELNTRLRFERLDTTTALVPPVAPPWSGRTRVVSHPSDLGRLLTGTDLQVFRDHRAAAATIHLALLEPSGGGVVGGAGGVRGEAEHCYVVLRRDRRKGLPLFASVLYAGNPDLLRRRAGDLGRHLLVRHGVPFTLVELRLVGGRPRGSVLLRSARPKMFRSTLPAEHIDNLYSELALVAW